MLETYFTQHFSKIRLIGLFTQTPMDWHFEVQPAGIAKISELPSNNWFLLYHISAQKKASL